MLRVHLATTLFSFRALYLKGDLASSAKIPYTVDVYRYKTIESIGNSFVTFPKGISYRFYQYYL